MITLALQDPGEQAPAQTEPSAGDASAVQGAGDAAQDAALAHLPRAPGSVILIAALAVIAALWWGQRFLIPLCGGLMLALLVTPLAQRLSVWLHSPMLAATVCLAAVAGLIALAVMAFGMQVIRVSERVPEMIRLAAHKVNEQDPQADSLMRRSREALQELDQAADRALGTPRASVTVRPPKRGAVAVAVTTPAAGASAAQGTITNTAAVALRESAVTGSSALLHIGANLLVMFFTAFFVLSGGRHLAVQFLDLWSYRPEALAHARLALAECAHQVLLYAAVLVITNSMVGISVWVAFSLAQLPDPAGWGVTAAILHIVPYLGMALLTGLGAAETYLTHQTVSSALGMAMFLAVLSTLIGTLITAWMQGRVSKVNPAVMFIGIVFWGALWGVWGLFLGPALVVLIKVLAQHSARGKAVARLMQG